MQFKRPDNNTYLKQVLSNGDDGVNMMALYEAQNAHLTTAGMASPCYWTQSGCREHPLRTVFGLTAPNLCNIQPGYSYIAQTMANVAASTGVVVFLGGHTRSNATNTVPYKTMVYARTGIWPDPDDDSDAIDPFYTPDRLLDNPDSLVLDYPRVSPDNTTAIRPCLVVYDVEHWLDREVAINGISDLIGKYQVDKLFVMGHPLGAGDPETYLTGCCKILRTAFALATDPNM